MVIAIDGPSGVGKSTIASAVANRLQTVHLDTGAMYRAAALAVLRAGVDPTDGPAVLETVRSASIRYPDERVYLDGVDVSREVRDSAVTAAVTPVAALPELRRWLVALQREWVIEQGGSAVVEGRDIGTVVFPHATVKIFLTARPEVRAARRAADAEAAGRNQGDVARDLERRDEADSTRQASPLRPADDAVVIDTSDLTITQVLDTVLEVVERASGPAGTPGPR